MTTRAPRASIWICPLLLIAAKLSAQGPLTITSTSPLPSGTFGQAYTFIFTATGGTQPYTWSADFSPQALGMGLASGGILTGSPGTAGTLSFTVKVTDAAQNTAQKLFQLTITGPGGGGTVAITNNS